MENNEKRDNSLGLISALYDSNDSDSNSDISSLADGFTERQAEISSSSSSNSEDSDSEDSESDLESIICRKPSFIPKQIRVKGELSVQDLPPIEDLHISVKEEECLPFGKVYSIVDTLLVIQSLPDKPALNLDSVFFRHNGIPVGRIFDVFGPVTRPFYSVRFNTNKEIIEKDLVVDMVLYAAPQTQHTQYVFSQQLFKEKGSDASWVNDCEPPAECLDYSDDEQERCKTRKQRNLVSIKQETVVEDDFIIKKKYKSFEERMNEDNALRNNHFNKMRTPTYRNRLDLGWHNRIDGSSKHGYRPAMQQIHYSPPPPNGPFQMRAPQFVPPPSMSPHPPVRSSVPPMFPPDYRQPFPSPTYNPLYPPPGWPNIQPSSPFDHQRFSPHNNSAHSSIHFSPSVRPPLPNMLPMPSNMFYEGQASSTIQPQSYIPSQYPHGHTSAAPHGNFPFPKYPTCTNSF